MTSTPGIEIPLDWGGGGMHVFRNYTDSPEYLVLS